MTRRTVYEAIIPHEESYSFAEGTLIIQSETSGDMGNGDAAGDPVY